MSVAKVVRDGVVRIFPVNLLVEGDVVEMIYGDVAPGRMKYIYQRPFDDTSPDTPSLLNQREYYLAEDQAFKPSFFGVPPPPGLMEEYLGCRGRHQFLLLENPLEDNMRTALSQTRPKTVLVNEARVLFHVLYDRLIWIFLALGFIINLLVFGLKEYRHHQDTMGLEQLVEQVFWLPFLAILPLLPLCVPGLWLIARSLGNAQLLILFEALQISKTEYEDDDEVDEFDAEAPPPTKDMELSPSK